MPHSEDDLPALFRSLKPDTENLHSIAMAAEKEADSRWPLLRDLSLKGGEVPPRLSTEERMCWNRVSETGVEGARTAALSLPSLSDKMAKSLERMSARVAPSMAKRAESLPPGQAASYSFQEQPQIPKNSDVDTGSTQALPKVDLKLKESEPVQELASILPAPAPAPVDAKSSEGSLTQIFNRLEGKEKPVSKPQNRPSSFMGRLGMR